MSSSEPRHEVPDLEHLLAQLHRSPARLWLPAQLLPRSQRQKRLLVWRGMAVLNGWMDVVLLLSWLLAPLAVISGMGLGWLWAAALLVVLPVGWLVHCRQRQRAQLAGWEVDMTTRTLQPSGMPGSLQALTPAQDWSLGTLPAADGSSRRDGYAIALELRHMRRGPVAVLIRVHYWLGSEALLLDIDELADQLAALLGVRRSGSRLRAGARHRLTD